LLSLVGILVLGFFLGMRHATDPDHVIAVTTIVTRQRGVARASLIGALWGMGHTFTIFVVGAAIILFKVSIPPRLGLSMEFAVGLMLILLGVLNLTGILRWLQREFTPSVDGATAEATSGVLRGMGIYNALRPLIIGIVHGLAGSAAVALVVMTAVKDPWWAIAYLLFFGLGTIAGMMVMTTMLALPIGYTGQKFSRWSDVMTVASGLLSVVFGLVISYQIAITGGLFSAVPQWTPR
jgi:high-affinity nickel-transport protein